MSLIAPDEVEDTVNLLRSKIGKNSQEDLETATDAVNKLGSAFLREDEQTLHTLRLPQEMMRHSLVDTLLDLVLAASPVLDDMAVCYYNALFVLQNLIGALANDRTGTQTILNLLSRRWKEVTTKFWEQRNLEILASDELHHHGYGRICQDLDAVDTFRRNAAGSEDYTMPLLAHYWAKATSSISRRPLECAIGVLSIRDHRDIVGLLDMQTTQYRFMESLWTEIGGDNPGAVVVTTMANTLDAIEGDLSTLSCGYFFLAMTSRILRPVMPHQLTFIHRLCLSSVFWQRFTAANLDEIKTRPTEHRKLQSMLIPIQAIMYTTRTMPSFQQPLVENLANSSVFDYLDEAVGLAPETIDAAQTILMFLNDLKSAVESANAATREAMGRQMPRARLLHILARNTSGSHWMPVMQIQAMVMDPLRCNRRGCEEKGKSQCQRCTSRYCSADCQKQDWAEHKLVCKILPQLRSKAQTA